MNILGRMVIIVRGYEVGGVIATDKSEENEQEPTKIFAW